MVGSKHTVAIQTDGTPWVWGSNGYGQLGDGTSDHKSTPTRIGTANTWASVAAGGTGTGGRLLLPVGHTVAIKTDSTLWAWGWNSAGQLGDGTTVDKYVPTPIP